MSDTMNTPDEPAGRGRLATGEQTGRSEPAATGFPTPMPADARSGQSARPAAPGNGSEGGTAPGRAADPTPNGATGPIVPSPTAPPAWQGLTAADVPSAAVGPGPAPGPGAATPPPWRRMPGQDYPDRVEYPAQAAPMTSLLDEVPTAYIDPAAGGGPAPTRFQASDAPASGGWSTVRAARNRPPRQAALQLKRLDPWSVLKLAMVLAVVLFLIWLVAVGVLYGVLDGMGVWDRLNGTYADLVSGDTASAGSTLISAGRVFGLAAVVGAINSLLFAVVVTVAAFVYNVSADLVGGIEATLSERD